MKQSTPHSSTGEILSKASILVALPQLQDTFFAKSVILLIEHNSSGAFGFVINRPTDVALRELIYLDEKINLSENARVWFGGPVSTNSGIILEYRPDLASIDALPFNITTKKESLLKMVSQPASESPASVSAQNVITLDHISLTENKASLIEREHSDDLEFQGLNQSSPGNINATVAEHVLEYIKSGSEQESVAELPPTSDGKTPPSEHERKLRKQEAKTRLREAEQQQRKVLFPYRFIMGYAGWNQDQLEEELILGNWIQLPFDENLVFNTPVEGLWEQCFTNLGITPEAIAPTIQPYLN